MNKLFPCILGLLIIFISCNKSNHSSLIGVWINVHESDNHVFKGFELNENGTVISFGMDTSRYEKWDSDGKQLFLKYKEFKSGNSINLIDTLNIINITHNSLKLEDKKGNIVAFLKNNTIKDIPNYNILDSLNKIDGLNDLQTRIYVGKLYDGKHLNYYNLLIYNLKYSGDGMWRMVVYDVNGNTFILKSGRMYTLRGDAENIDAVTYELIPFNENQSIYFLYMGDKLELLDNKLAKYNYKNNYLYLK